MLQISLLGEQVIRDAAGAVRTRSPRAVALVAFLVLHAGVPQSRQRLAALFWPDSSDAQALTNLRRELHHLRNVLPGEAALVVTSKDLCWLDTDTCQVDVRTFERERALAAAAADDDDDEQALAHATAAVASYGGELLPGGYYDWLLAARSELEDRCVDLLDLIARTLPRTSDLTGAVDAAKRRIALRPLEEVGYRILMELQADLGERASAVSTYHRCASVLERELGVEPDPITGALLSRLLKQTAPVVVAVEPSEPIPAARSGLASARLIGRSAELEVLSQWWRLAVTGLPRLALVRGDAGVGKTRLVSELVEVARLGNAVVATAHCFGTSGRLALSPVADWLRTPAIQAGLVALDPVWRVEVDRLLPSGRGRSEPGSGVRTMVDAWQRHSFFEGLARALIGVGGPMLLVLDNLQWCDHETLAFLSFFLGLTADTSVMVAATVRDEDDRADSDLLDWISRMRTTRMMSEVELGPLEISHTAELAEALSGRSLAADDAALLQATTGGFPLFIVEAARSSVDPGRGPLPVGDLTRVLRDRLDQVSVVARDIAGLAAAVGRNFSLDLLTEASDLDEYAVVRAVDELWRGRIVREVDDGYDFSHDLLRDAAYAQVSPARRWLLHRRVAQGLELLHANDTDAVSAQLAEQYARGGRVERAVGYYRRAADLAAGMFAHAESIRLHKEALALVRTLPEGRDRLRQELAGLEAMAAPLNANYGYSSRELQQTLQRSIALAEEVGSRDSVLTGLVGLWATQFVQGKNVAAYETATRALSLVEPDSALSAPAHFAIGGSAVSLGRPAEAVRHLELAVKLGGSEMLSVGTRPDVHGRAFAAHAYWLLGDHDKAVESSEDAVSMARTTGSPYNVAVALAYAGVTAQLCDDSHVLDQHVAELRELCDRYDFAYYREWALVLQGWSRGDAAGLDLARRGVDNLRSEGSIARMPYWLALLADLSARNGFGEDARGTLDGALVLGAASVDLWWLPEVMRMRAAYEDPSAAIDRLRAAEQRAAEHGSLTLLRRCQADLAALGVRLARRPNASRTLSS
ncbi:MAG: hypothetical protein QOE89_929 [Pseudonocardiales bacterium]|nr:hypothetical protein [Pseudonocardiales bacterium]